MPNLILKPHLKKMNLKTVDRRVSYLEELITAAHNQLIESDNDMSRSRFYNIIQSGIKLLHDQQTDQSLEELDRRLQEIEAEYSKLGGRT